MKTQEATVTQSYSVSIVTKYIGATNNRGSRIRVQRGDGGNTEETRKTYTWDYALDPSENHAQAIQKYLTHMGWGGTWVTGSTETGYVAVQVPQGGDQ